MYLRLLCGKFAYTYLITQNNVIMESLFIETKGGNIDAIVGELMRGVLNESDWDMVVADEDYKNPDARFPEDFAAIRPVAFKFFAANPELLHSKEFMIDWIADYGETKRDYKHCEHFVEFYHSLEMFSIKIYGMQPETVMDSKLAKKVMYDRSQNYNKY